jgi:hypothetical protein
VYFQRPHNGVILQALADDSIMIADAVARSLSPEIFTTGETANAWMRRRVRMRRIKNMTVRPSWTKSLSGHRDNFSQSLLRVPKPGVRAWAQSIPALSLFNRCRYTKLELDNFVSSLSCNSCTARTISFHEVVVAQ